MLNTNIGYLPFSFPTFIICAEPTADSIFNNFDHTLELKYGETLIINDKVKLHYNGTIHFHGLQAKFSIKAPQEICIMRLELFARYNQDYDHILELNLGEKINVPENNFSFVILQADKGEVKLGIYADNNLEIKKVMLNE